jgi:hypothetical protein
MDRTIFWSQNQSRTFDLVEGDHDALVALGTVVQDVLNSTTTVLSGFAGSQTTVPSLTINLTAGRIYQQAPADATANGAIPQDTTVITQQGFLAASQVTLSTSGLTTGQSRWALIEAQYSQVDSIRTADPNGGLLFFYNSANPNEPFQGPGNDGDTTPTVRQGLVVVQVVLGSAATTGSETPPSPTSGWVPMYLVDLSYGQTAITTSEILTAGPSVGTGVPNNYPYAPFLAGLLNSHHSGNAGQAPKINLATETQGTLPASSVASLYAVDSGSVNALVATLSPVPASLGSLLGRLVQVKVANSNTSTTPSINVNGLGAVTIVNSDLTPLLPGQLFAGGVSQLVYDGTYFQLQSAAQEHRGFANMQVLTGGTSGSPNTFTVPAGVFRIKATAIGGGGSGGGTPATGASQYSVGSGGNGGSWCVGYFNVTPGQTISYYCGGGVTGTAGANGTTGNTTSFNGLVAVGGQGGTVGVAGALGTITIGASPVYGASGGLINTNEQAGGWGFCLANTSGLVTSGIGGSGYFTGHSSFQVGGAGYGGNGFGSSVYGQGGSGAAAGNSAPTYTGGGAVGGCVLVEY